MNNPNALNYDPCCLDDGYDPVTLYGSGAKGSGGDPIHPCSADSEGDGASKSKISATESNEDELDSPFGECGCRKDWKAQAYEMCIANDGVDFGCESGLVSPNAECRLYRSGRDSEFGLKGPFSRTSIALPINDDEYEEACCQMKMIGVTKNEC